MDKVSGHFIKSKQLIWGL